MPNNTDASAHHDSLQQGGSLPFFARFLEGEDMTMKYPSDNDEWGPDS